MNIVINADKEEIHYIVQLLYNKHYEASILR